MIGGERLDLYPLVVMLNNFIHLFSLLCHQIGAPLAHADAVSVSAGGDLKLIPLYRHIKIG